MYDRDMPTIRAHALASPEGLLDVITFAILTIRQHLILIPPAFQDVKANGATSVHLLGSKRPGFAYASKHREVIFAAVKKAAEIGDTIGAIDVLLNVPSLGLVKAAFVAQMVGLECGCLDTHNQNRYGLTYRDVRFRKSATLRPETKRKRIENYLARCNALGGARALWNTWCAYVSDPAGRGAKFQNGLFATMKTAAEVSAMHCLAMGLPVAADGDAIPF